MNLIVRSILFFEKFKNPFEVFLYMQKKPGAPAIVKDKKSGLTLHTRAGAIRMIGEVLHDKDYIIPRLPLREKDIVIDIGANHGAFSLDCAKKGCDVYAFEPSPVNFDLLEKNVMANHLSGKINYYQKAVNDTTEECDFFEGDTLGGGKNTIIDGHLKNPSQKIRVACENLEKFIEGNDIKQIRLLKMDCEGAEFKIIKSLSVKTLSMIDAMIIEFHPGSYDMDAFIDYLMGLEYFELAFAEDKSYCQRDIIRLVSKKCIRQSLSNYN